MKIVKCWKLGPVFGRQGMIVRFSSKEEAEKAKSKRGVDPIIEEEEIIVFDSATEAFPDLDDEAKKNALAKLSDYECKALGLKE